MQLVHQQRMTGMSSSEDKQRGVWKWAKRQAIGRMDVSLGARECWRILDSFPAGRCYPTHYYIAERMLKSPSAVRRYLQELKEAGYIRITRHFDYRGQTSNRYTMLDQEDLIACAQQILQESQAKRRENG